LEIEKAVMEQHALAACRCGRIKPATPPKVKAFGLVLILNVAIFPSFSAGLGSEADFTGPDWPK
jgi:hypothetical protein